MRSAVRSVRAREREGGRIASAPRGGALRAQGATESAIVETAFSTPRRRRDANAHVFVRREQRLDPAEELLALDRGAPRLRGDVVPERAQRLETRREECANVLRKPLLRLANLHQDVAQRVHHLLLLRLVLSLVPRDGNVDLQPPHVALRRPGLVDRLRPVRLGDPAHAVAGENLHLRRQTGADLLVHGAVRAQLHRQRC